MEMMETQRQISERERIVRTAIRDLYEVGIKIESFAVHPATFAQMVERGLPMQLVLVPYEDEGPQVPPRWTYCGVLVNQRTD
jgi:hypothetical protein